MKELLIELDKLSSPEELYGLLARELNFPGYFGGNADALYDALTELPGEVNITLSGEACFTEMEMISRVLRDAAEANPALRVDM